MANYIKVIGNESYFQRCWKGGDIRTDKRIEMIHIASDYAIKNILKAGEVYRSHHNEKHPKLVNGQFTLKGYQILVDDICPCTDSEIEMLNNEMSKHNMYWGNVSFQQYDVWGNPFTERTSYDTLLWKDKENFPIVLNGKKITYKQLSEIEHGDYITLSGDNGYSHCWAESADFSKVFEIVEKIFRKEDDFTFAEKKRGGFAFAFNKVNFGNIYGYNFDEFGALVVRTTNKAITPMSVVSNT